MLLTCPECGNHVSDRALSCPHCGCPIDVIVQSVETVTMKSISSERLKQRVPIDSTTVNKPKKEERGCGRKRKKILRIPLLCLIPTVVLVGSFFAFALNITVFELKAWHTNCAALGFMWMAWCAVLHFGIRILQGYSWPRWGMLFINVVPLLPSITNPAILCVLLMWGVFCLPYWSSDTVCRWFAARKRLRLRKSRYHVVTRLVLSIEVVGCVCFLYWLSHPERYIKAASDDRQGSHPCLFGVHLREEIRSRIDMPKSFSVTGTSLVRSFYPVIIWKGLPHEPIIQGVKSYGIVVSKLNNQVERIFFEKEYFEKNTSAVWRDYQKLTDYVNKNFFGPMKDEERDGRWKRSWDLGYGQSLEIEFKGLNCQRSSFLTLNLKDDGLESAMIRVGIQRGGRPAWIDKRTWRWLR